MSTPSGPAIGTAFHPEPEPTRNGRARTASQPVALTRLPRRRRPGMIALAVALVGAGILASATVYTQTNHRVPVLVAEATVPAGSVITAGDVGTASVSAGPGVQVVPASQLRQVVGQVAGTGLHPGMLITAAEIGAQRPPIPGQVLVPLPVHPSALPASGLQPGDRVLIIPTPGAQGQAGSGNSAPAMSSPVAGVVAAVRTAVSTDGFAVVDVLIPARFGTSVASQASTGQFAVVVIRRSPG